MNRILQAKELLVKHISQQRSAKQFRLPPERTLAEQFGYSRATIGKALGVLEGEGMVLRKRGDGTYITHKGENPTLTLALVMRQPYYYTDAHFRLIVDEISRYSAKNNFYIQIFDNLLNVFKDDPDNNSLMQSIKNGIIDGVLIASRMDVDIVARISKACPTVAINNLFGNGSDITCISCDYFRVGFLAGKYLLEKGHRKVAYITETLTHPETSIDFSGFSAVFEMAGIELCENDILEIRKYAESFNEKLINFLKKSHYTACFVRSTMYALSIISTLEKNGIRVPGDLSVIAAGNYGNGQSKKLKLTVIDTQLSKMCEIGLKALRDLITNNRKTEGGIKLLKPEIIERDSVTDINEK
jgi:DNA-binding LacI/PurR family transcriptional regulator